MIFLFYLKELLKYLLNITRKKIYLLLKVYMCIKLRMDFCKGFDKITFLSDAKIL